MNNDCNHRKSQCDSCKCGISIRTIPAALGDDTGKFKPENGADHNAFWKYEANGAQYFFSKEGIFSKVAELPEYIQKQADWNETDVQSPSYIMNKPDVATVNDIDQEIVMREAEDEHLNDLINGLGDELNDEINARIQADAGLTERLDAIDLTDYVKRTDFPTATTAGVIRDANCFLTSDENGGAYAEEMSYDSYSVASDYNFIGKGTLENVLNARKYLKTLYTLELPATGSEDTLYLTPAEEQPDVEASASGKDITITDASEGDLIDWRIKGDTEQDGEPTPDYPQEVKAVTGRNTVSVVGKNLWIYSDENFYKANNSTYSINPDGSLTVITPTNGAYKNVAFSVGLKDGTYTFSLGDVESTNQSMTYKRMTVSYYVGEARTVVKHIDAGTPQTITLEDTDNRAYVLEFWTSWATSLTNTATFRNVQIEKGNSKTSYQPYSGQEVEIDLGDIELCKLGDYQDRIFKDANEWKIEKQIGKWTISEADTGQGMTWEGANHRLYCSLQWQQQRGIDFKEQPDANIPAVAVSNRFLIESFKNLYTDGIDGFALSTSSAVSFRKNAWANGETAKAEIVGTVFYYAKITPTITTIEDQTLIDQLNALETLTTQSGINTITTETENLKPFLEFSYYRPDPTVTKEEWLWVEDHYEQIGGQRRYTHNLVVNHSTAQGHWDYAFTIVGKDASHYTQLAQVAYYLFREHAGLSIPVSGTYVEGSDVYILTKITASSLGQVTIEMRKLSDGSLRSISTGAVPVLDTIS